MLTLAQTSAATGPDAVAGGFLALVGGLWCCGLSAGVTQIVLAIVALVQVLSRQTMSGNDKLLWAAVSWFLPILGPILWWTIGSKQFPAPRPPRDETPRGPGTEFLRP